MVNLSTTRHIKELYAHINNGSDLILTTFVNPFSYYDLSQEMIKEIDYFFSDGILLTKLNNIFRANKIDRISFDSTSLAYPLFNFCEDKKLSIALVGATKKEINNFSQFIKNKFPLLDISFVSSGYIAKEEKDEVIARSLSSDILIVGMGFPFQEEFLLEVKKHYLESDQLKLAITCGGFFTQHQEKDYYPKLIDKFELRWLYRLIFTQHVRKKVITKYPHFILRYLYNALF
ncbi:WecB/TagA/CpsF family glycosyltransferase [Photobacterium leiognathi]|uniref:WecB/TagA/CpsF family glycosyltransferase n=1 Tax=Photobacterium leiognathi TaxID=553611 RepID=UPI002980F4A5|nr:WecB/TagA/CpsF family glycosyltransferase [Photobacterium leiognathi]